jgi:Family of unknown function (DUF6364)
MAYSVRVMKSRLNLYVDEKLIERAKLQGVLQKRSVSEIVEDLLRVYLDGLEKTKGKGNPN